MNQGNQGSAILTYNDHSRLNNLLNDRRFRIIVPPVSTTTPQTFISSTPRNSFYEVGPTVNSLTGGPASWSSESDEVESSPTPLGPTIRSTTNSSNSNG